MKYEDTSWDFRNEDTKRATHCFHAYPAMMIPQIAEKILFKYGRDAERLFDPYCGTGTSLVEANIKNINAIGTDLNPLARLIAKSKTTIIDTQILDLYLKDFNDFIFQFRFGIKRLNYSVVKPNFKNIDFWFSESTQTKLSIIKFFLDEINHKDVKSFFLTAFSETIRESSLTKKSEFKLIRMPESKRNRFDPDCFGIMLSKLIRNRTGLIEFTKLKINGASTEIKDFNTVDGILNEDIADESIDIVLTSPPYGDSRTTVAYGQYSRLSNQWMGIENASGIDNILMGGTKCQNISISESNALNQVLEQIAEQDTKRADEVLSFFLDYKKSIDNIASKLKHGKYACYVVGNRSVKGIQIPMDEITKDFFASNGYIHKETIIRNIPNKRMPSLNSPTNIVGAKSSTMKNEFIVVMQRL